MFRVLGVYNFALHLKKTFPLIVWIFTEGEGDGIESRLPFQMFSTLHCAEHALLYPTWWIAKETLKISSFHMICTKTTVTTFKANTLIQSNWNYAGCGGALHKNSF